MNPPIDTVLKDCVQPPEPHVHFGRIPPYNWTDALYAKDCIAVTIAPHASGLKTSAHDCADSVHARYSHRENAYIMTNGQFLRFRLAFQAVCPHPPSRYSVG